VAVRVVEPEAAAGRAVAEDVAGAVAGTALRLTRVAAERAGVGLCWVHGDGCSGGWWVFGKGRGGGEGGG
jgi:hypothetical protein